MNHTIQVVYLIGVDHRIQYTNNTCGPEWRQDIKSFEDYLVSKTEEMKIELLAEEFSQENIERNNATGCTVKDAAQRCHKQHLFCDPTKSERESEGIDDDDKRENFWLEKLKNSNASVIMFVCGDSHINSFSEKVRANMVQTKILSNGWGNDWMYKQ